jgi:hypothetical protein
MKHAFGYVFVAGVGRREIGSVAQLRTAVRDTLVQIASAFGDDQPVALASGAAGTDQVFLDVARELGWPIKLVLPCPAYQFEQDFVREDSATGARIVDESGAAKFRELHSVAIDVEVIAPAPGRRDAFTRAADRLLAQADVLVGVWDGKPGRSGGTNEALLLAEQLDIPVLLLDAATGRRWPNRVWPEGQALQRRQRARHEAPDGTPEGILADVDRSIVEGLRHEAEESPQGTGDSKEFFNLPLNEQKQRLGTVLAGRAGALAERHRRWNILVLLLHGLATTVGLSALVFQEQLPAASATIASWVKLLLVLAAIGITIRLRRHRAHRRWVRARFVREVNRSLSATSPLSRRTGEAIGAFVPSALWCVFARLQYPLLTFHALATPLGQGASLADVLAKYRQARLAHRASAESLPSSQTSQQDYQRREAAAAERTHHRIETLFFVCTGLLLLCAVLGVSVPHEHSLYPWAKLGTVLLPVVVASLLVLPNLHDSHRRLIVGPALAGRLAELDRQMAEVEAVLRAGATVPGIGAAVAVWGGSEAERSAAAEAWAKNRAVEIVRAAEYALLAELIGFKTFVESVEVG